MSNSTDSLKKKVCVTVFLDELFEEVDDEDHRYPDQVSEVTESEVKIAEQTCKTSSEYDLDNHEKINISPNSDTKENEPEPRPRKHRRESKFSRNSCDSFKYGLDKYEYGANNNTKIKPVESTFSDSDLDQHLELGKCLYSGSKNSLSNFSEFDLKEQNSAAVNLNLSSMMVCREIGGFGFTKTLDDNVQSGVISYCSRSTQFDGRKNEAEKVDEKFEIDTLLMEDQEKKTDEDLMWKKTRKQIQLILAKARNRCKERDVCDGDQIKHFDLRSILEECEKRGKKTHLIDGIETYVDLLPKASMDCRESDIQNISDSYTCVFPHNRQGSQNQILEVKKVWVNTEKNVWNDGFESDASDSHCTTYLKRINSLPLKADSSLCYALCVKCRENIFKKTHKEINTNADNAKLVNNLKPTGMTLSLHSGDSKTSKNFGKVGENSLEVSAEIFDTAQFAQKDVVEDKKETDVEIAPLGKSEGPVRRKNKNYAEGDTVEKSLNKVSELTFLSNSELFVGKKIISDVDETNMDEKKNVFDGEEVALSKSKTRKEEKTYRPTRKTTEGIAEVFIKSKKIEGNDRNMTDAESEMIFAESEDFCENEDFLSYKFYFESTSYKIHSELSEEGKDVCLIEIEDKLSRSKILKRIKTVEILGDETIRDMKNISTEVILICEKVSNSELCLEACQSSVSTLRSFTEGGQCYLKDSKDSSMYLIEIPLHFTHPQEK